VLQHVAELTMPVSPILDTVGSFNSIIFLLEKHSAVPYAPTRVDSLLHENGSISSRLVAWETAQPRVLPPSHRWAWSALLS
jgi:hypothetical protein